MENNMQTQNSGGPTIINSGLRRPDWICRNCHQLVILVRDKSGSMAGDKARDASAASADLVKELSAPANKDGFFVSVVDFSNSAEIAQAKTRATTLQGNISGLNVGFLGGSTNITAGLELAADLINANDNAGEQGVRWLRPVVILFTDGQHNAGPAPDTVATKLKSKADLVTVAFGSDAAEADLKLLATSSQHFYRCSNGAELRKFLAAVGATISASLAAGVNSTQALTQVKQ
jgi:uncharacterized protein YegL